MKKTIAILGIALTVIIFGACETGGDAAARPELTGDETITMDNIDEYLDADARFVDLRDFTDMIESGYIHGFEVVPFFQYLDGRALVRNDGWNFSADDVASRSILTNIFGDDLEQPIVLMCAAGGRAGYVKDALEHLGYTTVYNAGGMRDYTGDYQVLADTSYNGLPTLPESVTMDNIDNFLDRPGAKYVDVRNVADKYTGGYIDGFEVVSFFEYFEGRAVVRNDGWNFSPEDILSEAVIRNIFGRDLDREIFIMCAAGGRAGYMKDVLESLGYTTVFNVGGLRDYNGENLIFGDEAFTPSFN
ncbi:MAG: rhodanese-like domain-containing protein [Spirochaetaceae bacterium]